MAEYPTVQLSPGNEDDHETRILALEGQYAPDDSRADSDHTTAQGDHTTAGTDHSTASGDHSTADGDHILAAADHVTAGGDHTAIASQDIPFFYVGKPTGGQVLALFVAARALTLPADLSGSRASVVTNPKATTTLTLNKNGAPVGTIAFATNGTPTATSAGFSLAAGDVLSLVNQEVADDDAEGFIITLKATRS